MNAVVTDYLRLSAGRG